jgi:hypothetical protein
VALAIIVKFLLTENSVKLEDFSKQQSSTKYRQCKLVFFRGFHGENTVGRLFTGKPKVHNKFAQKYRQKKWPIYSGFPEKSLIYIGSSKKIGDH